MEAVHFPASDGTRLSGWLFGKRGAPIVIMAPGLTGTKESFYADFAKAFVARGMAVLLFDYRCCGESEGTPRYWVDPLRQVEDYGAAIKFARTFSPSIALWGTSFSGGVALVAAEADPIVSAVVAQCPYLETSDEQQPKGLTMARFVAAATLDMVGLFPVYIPAFGRPGEFAFCTSAENPSRKDGSGGHPFWKEVSTRNWENKILARMLARLDDFSPMRAVEALRGPVLMIAGIHDDMVPAEPIRRAPALLPASRLVEYPCGHFDLYFHEENKRVQADFLAERLMASRESSLRVT